MGNVSDYLYAKASRNKIPLNGTFELSPVCNFACKMCYVRKTPAQIQKEGKRLIPWEKWLDLASQCRDAGTLYLLLTGGEPFLYPGFRELYIELHKMGFILSINSNGTMIDEETVQWLKAYAPSRVNITLYGASADTYGRLCGNSDGFERAVNAIRLLTEAGIPVVINASMIPENACDLEKIIAIGKEQNLNTRISTYMLPPMRRDREECDSRFTAEESAQMYLRKAKRLFSHEEYQRWIRDTLHQIQDASRQEDDWGEDSEFMRCRAGRSSFWINWEGYMTACGLLDFPVRTAPFRETFKDSWLRLTNAVRTTPVLHGCAGCEKRKVCNPCVAFIYGETGTVDQKSPYMCRIADTILACMREEQEVL